MEVLQLIVRLTTATVSASKCTVKGGVGGSLKSIDLVIDLYLVDCIISKLTLATYVFRFWLRASLTRCVSLSVGLQHKINHISALYSNN